MGQPFLVVDDSRFWPSCELPESSLPVASLDGEHLQGPDLENAAESELLWLLRFPDAILDG